MNIILSLAGGLGFFLYGMKMMSEGLQKVAGSKLRSILEVFTKNRVIGMFVGIVFTALIQSSNATTVMVVSFVNSGLMKLSQTAGIILGASIGTTVTGQLIAFDLEELAPLFIILGVVLILFIKKQKTVNRLGEVFFGFGILFMGISGISGALGMAKEIPMVVNTLSSLSNPVLAFLVGVIATAILQSNSATVGIVMLLARENLVDLQICLFMVLGCNIGCTMSSMIACIGCKKDAKRTAMVHLLFNVIGSLVCAVIFAVAGKQVVDFFMNISGQEGGRMIANANSIIKVSEVLVMLPCTQWLVKATYLLVRGEDEGEHEFALLHIHEGNAFSLTTAVVQVIHEVKRMADLAVANLKLSMETLLEFDQEKVDQVYRAEENIDFLNREITNYMIKLIQSDLPAGDSKRIGSMFHVVNDIERIGDHAENIADAAIMMKNTNTAFSPMGKGDLKVLLEKVLKIMEYSVSMFSGEDMQHIDLILELENSIDEMEREMQQAHVERLTRNACTPEAGAVFSDVASGLERVADHATNIAFSVLDEDPDEKAKEK